MAGCGTRAGSSSTWTARWRSATGSTTGWPRCPAPSRCCAGCRSASVPYVVFTNGTNRSPQHFAAVLRDAGLDVPDARMMTPASSAVVIFTKARLQAGHGARRRRADRAAARGAHRGRAAGGSRAGHPARRRSRRRWTRCSSAGSASSPCPHLEAACQAVWSGAALYSRVGDAVLRRGGRPRARHVPGDLRHDQVHHRLPPHRHRQAVPRPRCAPPPPGSASPTRDLVVVGDDPLLEVPMAHRGHCPGRRGADRPGRAGRLRPPAARRSGRTCTCAASTSCCRSAENYDPERVRASPRPPTVCPEERHDGHACRWLH